MSPQLNLGVNKDYRADIEFAAARTNLDPAVIAAVIDMEALKSHGVWQKESKNPHSSAQGLTQFVSATWIGEAEKPGRYLNEYAKANGLIDARNHIVPGKTKELLDLRNDPKLAIVAAAEYDSAHYRDLAHKGVFNRDATPEQQARDLYAVHLLGPGGATQYVDGTTSPSAAHQRLKQNGQNIDDAVAKHGGNFAEAWHAFVDTRLAKVDAGKFRGPEPALAPIPLPAPQQAAPQQAATELAR
jgi:hypothetical protein